VANAQKSVQETGQELLELLRDYARQETFDPLKRLGLYLAWGIGGALLLAVGIFFVALGGLRALQTQTGTTFTGGLSWLPYFIIAVALLVVVAISAFRISHAGRREHQAAR
jgi:hypothetical protein